MRQKSKSTPVSSEGVVREPTGNSEAPCGETSIAELCRREGIAESMYYSWWRGADPELVVGLREQDGKIIGHACVLVDDVSHS